MRTYTEQEVRAIVLAFALSDSTMMGHVLADTEIKEVTTKYLDKVFKQPNATVSEAEHSAHADRAKNGTHGRVFFYEPEYNTKTIKEIGRTGIHTAQEALTIYAETPNPASQLLLFSTEGEHQLELIYYAKCSKDRAWLDELFNQI